MLPIKVLESWTRVNKRIDEFCKGDLSSSFKMLFITDVHIGMENKEHIRQLGYINELIKINPVNFIVNGGDIGIDVGEDDIEAERVIKVTEEATNYNIPYFLMKGNHDFKESLITDQGLNKRLNSYFVNHSDNKNIQIYNNDNSPCGYGFYVDHITDTRIIFLNTSEKYRQYLIGKEQLSFLIQELENAKEKNIIIMSHFCPNKCGEWVRYPNTLGEGMLTLQQIEKDFVNRNSGSNFGLKWDFTKTKSTLRIHLCGDSHFNNHSNEDGYLIACRQGFGGIDKEDIPQNGTVDKFDKINECNFDILVINKDNQLKLFRVGAGETIQDLEL